MSTDSSASKKVPLIAVIGVIFAIIVIAVVGYTIYLGIYNATLTLNVAPDTVTITLQPDNAKLSRGKNRLKPGSYTLHITADGFVEQSQDFTISKDENLELFFALDPTPDNADYYSENADQYEYILQYLTDEATNTALQAAVANNPVITSLPYIDSGVFRVDYALYTAEFTLVVTIFVERSDDPDPAITEANKQAFLEWYESYRTTSKDTKEYPIEYIYY